MFIVRFYRTRVIARFRRALAMPAVWSSRQCAGPGPWVLTDRGVVYSFDEWESD